MEHADSLKEQPVPCMELTGEQARDEAGNESKRQGGVPSSKTEVWTFCSTC